MPTMPTTEDSPADLLPPGVLPPDLLPQAGACSPSASMGPDGSCFGPDLLREIDEALGGRAAREALGCDTDRCVAEGVPDRGLRARALERLRPAMPEEWRSNPAAWLGNATIDEAMRQYMQLRPDFLYLGALPVDFDAQGPLGTCAVSAACRLTVERLARDGVRAVGLIINTDPQGQPGRHWMALHLDVVGGRFSFFDSVGSPPPQPVRAFCDRLAAGYAGTEVQPRLRWSERRHQHENTECGVYGMLFLAHMVRGGSFRRFMRRPIPDDAVRALRRRFFDPAAP